MRYLQLVTDGGSRGNPGPAAAAYEIVDENGHRVAAGAEYIGEATNNEAEYRALILGLRTAREREISALEWTSDSQLVVNQVSGEFRVLNARLKALWHEAMAMAEGLELVPSHRPRSDPRIARVDAMVNAVLDELEASGG